MAMALNIDASISTQLTWNYEPSNERLVHLAKRGESSQWSADDLDWSVEVPYGEALPSDQRFLDFSGLDGPLQSLGASSGDAFRWEFQNWMVSQFLHGEQAALIASARLIEVSHGIEAKTYAANQVTDEARHVEVFSRYAREKLPHYYPVSEPLSALLEDTLQDARWDITQLGMHIVIEGLAMASFRLGASSFHDPLIKDLCQRVAHDEARHVAFGIISLEPEYRELSSVEFAEREEFVLEAANLMARRFLLREVWERLGVDGERGTRFARTSPLMTNYRQAVFTKVISSLHRIGLLTPRVQYGLESLDLVGYAGSRLAARGRES